MKGGKSSPGVRNIKMEGTGGVSIGMESGTQKWRQEVVSGEDGEEAKGPCEFSKENLICLLNTISSSLG